MTCLFSIRPKLNTTFLLDGTRWKIISVLGADKPGQWFCSIQQIEEKTKKKGGKRA